MSYLADMQKYCAGSWKSVFVNEVIELLEAKIEELNGEVIANKGAF